LLTSLSVTVPLTSLLSSSTLDSANTFPFSTWIFQTHRMVRS